MIYIYVYFDWMVRMKVAHMVQSKCKNYSRGDTLLKLANPPKD